MVPGVVKKINFTCLCVYMVSSRYMGAVQRVTYLSKSRMLVGCWNYPVWSASAVDVLEDVHGPGGRFKNKFHVVSVCTWSHLGIWEQCSAKTAPESRVIVMYRAFELLQRRLRHRDRHQFNSPLGHERNTELGNHNTTNLCMSTPTTQ